MAASQDSTPRHSRGT
uniref:Uncharacterized protein n=1 Tax=Anguilla anguilla TaxID=7936 RepID=A0A0E9VEN2_ANGAN